MDENDGLTRFRMGAGAALMVVARAMNDEGWTCQAHEPDDFGACTTCYEGQMRCASTIVERLLHGEPKA